MNHKKFTYIISTLLILVLLSSIGFCLLYCPHSATHTIVSENPTCTQTGQEDLICDKCETIIESHTLPALGHSVNHWELCQNPTPTSNGVQKGACKVCGEILEREYICPHTYKHIFVAEEPTCTENGVEETACNLCQTILSSKTIPINEHVFGEWEVCVAATPIDDGQK